MANSFIQQKIQESIKVKQCLLEDIVLLQNIQMIAELITKAMKRGNKLMICGNGGSAADSQHIAAEFTGRFYLEREPLPAIALTTDTSALTAIGNDYGYEDVFLRQVKALGRDGDVLVGFSTSGNSKNIVKAMEYAKTKNIINIALTGKSGGKMKEIADVLINVPSDDTPRIQESHGMIGHIMCEMVEMALFESAQKAIPVQYK